MKEIFAPLFSVSLMDICPIARIRVVDMFASEITVAKRFYCQWSQLNLSTSLFLFQWQRATAIKSALDWRAAGPTANWQTHVCSIIFRFLISLWCVDSIEAIPYGRHLISSVSGIDWLLHLLKVLKFEEKRQHIYSYERSLDLVEIMTRILHVYSVSVSLAHYFIGVILIDVVTN